jgi:DNA-binding transcriptional ArsR family regulator
MLDLLNGRGEACVTDVATHCGLPVHMAAHHLRQLQGRGLIRATRRSRWVFYAAKTDPLVRHAAALLEAILPAVRTGGDRVAVRRALTAYTHARRIAIVRALSAGPRSPAELSSVCGISRPALARHLAKLRRRGVVGGHRGICALASPDTPFARRLLRLVLSPR